jgi:hypothetical protein
MGELNGHKPRGRYCRKGELMKWTGLSDKTIRNYVKQHRLKILRERPNGYPYYEVASMEQILEEGENNAEGNQGGKSISSAAA